MGTVPTVYCALLGDSGVGKTSIYNYYKEKYHVSEGVTPSSIEGMPSSSSQSEPTTNSPRPDSPPSPVQLSFWDLPGMSSISWMEEELSRLRTFCFFKTDLFLICFSLAEPTTLENVKIKWFPVVKKYCPKTPILLIGTKLDLKHHKFSPVQRKESETAGQGQLMARRIEAVKYIECSTVADIGMEEVFLEAIRGALSQQQKRKWRCLNCTLM